MPKYTFYCEPCNLKFSKSQRKRNPHATAKCPLCSSPSKKQFDAPATRFENGKQLGASGVYSLDTNVDLAVGRDASVRWEHIKDRTREKSLLHEEMRRKYAPKEAQARAALKKDSEGSYSVMTHSEVKANTTLRTQNHEAFTDHVKETGKIPGE